MSALVLLLATGCGADLPEVLAPNAPALQPGTTTTPLREGPPWKVTLKAGEPLFVGALSAHADLALTVQPPSGVMAGSESRRNEHRAANLRVIAPVDGAYIVQVAGLQPDDRGDVTLIRREPMTGDLCQQLERLSTGDSWALPGVEHASEDSAKRTRSLVQVMPWAHECTVNRLGDLDVGPSCALSRISKEAGLETYASLELEFRACHEGWMITEERDASTRERVAERDGALHFVRLRDNGERGWEVSTGAMPVP